MLAVEISKRHFSQLLPHRRPRRNLHYIVEQTVIIFVLRLEITRSDTTVLGRRSIVSSPTPEVRHCSNKVSPATS